MAEDHLKALPVARVAAWYLRLADAWSKKVPELQPSLAGAFLRKWVENRNRRAKIEFDAPAHLRSNQAVRNVQTFHRDVFLTNKKARMSGGSEKWPGVLPRIQGVAGFTKWDLKAALPLEYESLDVVLRPWAVNDGAITGLGTVDRSRRL